MRTVIFKMFDYKVWLVSGMLDSCKKFKYQDYSSNYLQFYQYI